MVKGYGKNIMDYRQFIFVCSFEGVMITLSKKLKSGTPNKKEDEPKRISVRDKLLVKGKTLSFTDLKNRLLSFPSPNEKKIGPNWSQSRDFGRGGIGCSYLFTKEQIFDCP